MMPEIPDSWSQAIAAVGAILVLVLFMRFTAELLKGQGKQSATLIDRAFDIADRTLLNTTPPPPPPPPPPEEIVTPVPPPSEGV